jgi:hypothetical protein
MLNASCKEGDCNDAVRKERFGLAAESKKRLEKIVVLRAMFHQE